MKMITLTLLVTAILAIDVVQAQMHDSGSPSIQNQINRAEQQEQPQSMWGARSKQQMEAADRNNDRLRGIRDNNDSFYDDNSEHDWQTGY